MKTKYYNGFFYTLRQEMDVVNELWVEQGVIIHLGPHPHWKADSVVDVNGWIGFPGFVDSHMHLIGYAESLTRLQLHKNPHREEVLTLVKHHFQGKPLFVQGHVEQALDFKDLDKISTEVPILLRHADYHGATVNSVMLRQIGLSNHPTGILHEHDALMAIEKFPKYTPSELVQLIKTGLTKLYAYGLTGAHTDDMHYFNGFQPVLSAFQTVLMSHPFRLQTLIHHLELPNYLQALPHDLINHPYLQLGPVGEIFYDGTISSQTALMHHPYRTQSTQGIRQFSHQEWQLLVKKVRQLGLSLAVHAIGDLALEEVITTLTQFPVKEGLFDRIIHASCAKISTIEKMKEVPILVDIQPQFVPSDLPWAMAMISEKTERIYPWKSYLDSGLRLCGGSDAPVEIPDPLKGIEAAVQRQSVNGVVYHPEECLSMYQAIQLYTTGANAAFSGSIRRGKLDVGFIADFTFIDADILKYPSSISKAKVMMTVIDNQTVYRSGNS